MFYNFTPVQSAAVTMTGSSVSTTLSAAGAAAPSMYIYNSSSTNKMFVKWGSGSATATSDGTSMCVPPNGFYVVGKGLADTIAIIGTNADVAYFSVGHGG